MVYIFETLLTINILTLVIVFAHLVLSMKSQLELKHKNNDEKHPKKPRDESFGFSQEELSRAYDNDARLMTCHEAIDAIAPPEPTHYASSSVYSQPAEVPRPLEVRKKNKGGIDEAIELRKLVRPYEDHMLGTQKGKEQVHREGKDDERFVAPRTPPPILPKDPRRGLAGREGQIKGQRPESWI
ncbi:hypothetical protein IQ07DRAFT_646579 [Pyrenochaeta sp. DS3sAY3a]|nr:hypothetical protein IQ07DRAFT_646579 [Pyrenochaeta sp. DS3sAY3a]